MCRLMLKKTLRLNRKKSLCQINYTTNRCTTTSNCCLFIQLHHEQMHYFQQDYRKNSTG